jgi:ABC-type transporter Mla MlaB component
MIKKYTGLIVIIMNLQSHAQQDGKVFTMTVIPDEVEFVNITPYNNNRHIIEYRNGKGHIIKADDSWRKKVLITDPNTIKAMERKSNPHNTPPEKKEATFCVVNNNDHTIVQNNSSTMQTEVKPFAPAENRNSAFTTGYFALLSGMIADHKYKIILGSCGICWLALYTRLLYLSYKITSSNGWSTWSKHLTLDGLQQADSAALVSELLKDIQNRYAKRKTSILSPLVQFINEADAELECLNSFLRLHEILNNTKLAFLFPKQIETIRLAVDQIQRLEFLKSIIIQATPEFKKNYLI